MLDEGLISDAQVFVGNTNGDYYGAAKST